MSVKNLCYQLIFDQVFRLLYVNLSNKLKGITSEMLQPNVNVYFKRNCW